MSQRAESLLRRWGRRVLSIALIAGAWCLAAPCLLLLPLLALLDLATRARLARTRAALIVGVYLSCELLGLLAAASIWPLQACLSRPAWLRLNVRLQRLWVLALLGALRRVYGLRLRIEGAGVLEDRSPVVLLCRHVSTADTLLPIVLLAGWSPRYVLKYELLWDPCLDVVGQRIPNAFVRRGGQDTPAELGKLQALALGLVPGHAAVIFPEGTRYSPGKRARVLERLERAGDPLALERAQALRHVLPPRWAGTHALLSACPTADVVLVAHVGLEGARSLASLVRGDLNGRELRVWLQRIPAAEVPREPAAFRAWLESAWSRVDAWLATQQGLESPRLEASA